MNITFESEQQNMSNKIDNLNKILSKYGNYDVKYKTLYLTSNETLSDVEFLKIMSEHKFFIQPNLL